ncbi:MAG TPA: cell division protein FtsQ/DivIB [Burkholderiaceae bacterium]|nr:cell division protein FtsQ/DivIB [Burkholderiaceae bacterium]
MAKRNTSNPSFQSGATPAVPLDVRLTRMVANALLVLAAGALLAMAVLAVSRSPLFNIRAISLEGDLQHNTVPLVRAIVLPRLSGNYFSLNLREARRTFESVPWVRRATVRRVWPNRLVVTLEQHRAAAYWEQDGERDDGSHQLVNLQGEVFEVNLGDVEEDGLPQLRGPEGTAPQVWQMYRQLAPVFTALGEKVRHLRVSMRGSWQTTLESGARVELGRGTPDEVLERTQRFAATVAQVTSRYPRDGRRDGQGIEYADLRHDDAYALRLRGVSTQRDAEIRIPAPSARPARR